MRRGKYTLILSKESQSFSLKKYRDGIKNRCFHIMKDRKEINEEIRNLNLEGKIDKFQNLKDLISDILKPIKSVQFEELGDIFLNAFDRKSHKLAVAERFGRIIDFISCEKHIFKCQDQKEEIIEKDGPIIDLQKELIGLSFFNKKLYAVTPSEIIEISMPNYKFFISNLNDSKDFKENENKSECQSKIKILCSLENKNEFASEVKINPVKGDVFLLLETKTGSKRRIAYFNINSPKFEYSEYINRSVKQIIIDFKSELTLFLRFRYKISKLEFHKKEKKLSKIYFSINKIKHFDLIRKGELVIIHEKKNLKVFTKDWKIVSIINLDGNGVKKIWSNDLFCLILDTTEKIFLVDFECWKVVNVFNENKEQKNINGGFLYMIGERMAVCHSKGLALWQIETPKLKCNFEQDLSLAKFYKPVYSNQILIVTKDYFFYQLVLSNFKIIDRRRLNKNISDFKFFFEDYIIAVIQNGSKNMLYVGRISIINDIILQDKGKLYESHSKPFKLLHISRIWDISSPSFYIVIEKQGGILLRIRIDFEEEKTKKNIQNKKNINLKLIKTSETNLKVCCNQKLEQIDKKEKQRNFSQRFENLFEEINEFEFGKPFRVDQSMGMCSLTIRQKLIKKIGSDIESDAFQMKMMGRKIQKKLLDEAKQIEFEKNFNLSKFRRKSIRSDMENKNELLRNLLKNEKFPVVKEIKKINLKTMNQNIKSKNTTFHNQKNKSETTQNLQIKQIERENHNLKKNIQSQFFVNKKFIKKKNRKNQSQGQTEVKESTILSGNQTLDEIEIKNHEIASSTRKNSSSSIKTNTAIQMENQTKKINVLPKKNPVAPIFEKLNQSLSNSNSANKFQGLVDDVRQLSDLDIIFIARKEMSPNSPMNYIIKLEAIQIKSHLKNKKKKKNGLKFLKSFVGKDMELDSNQGVTKSHNIISYDQESALISSQLIKRKSSEEIYDNPDIILTASTSICVNDFLDSKDNFIMTMNKNRIENKYFIYLLGTLGLYSFQFCPVNFTLELKGSLKVNFDKSIGYEYCPARKIIYIAQENILEIWSQDLKVKVYEQEFENRIIKIFWSFGPPALLIYDEKNFYEFNLLLKKITRKISCVTPCGKVFLQNISMNRILENSPDSFPLFAKPAFQLLDLDSESDFSIRKFSFRSLYNSLSHRDYKSHVQQFAKFYFETRRELDVWGQLNPYNLAIYHNDNELLLKYLNSHTYINFGNPHFSIINFAFRQGRHSLINSLCENLFQSEQRIEITREDFEELIDSKSETCHKLLSKILVTFECFKKCKLMYLKKKVITRFDRDMAEFFQQIKTMEIDLYRKNTEYILNNLEQKQHKNENKKICDLSQSKNLAHFRDIINLENLNNPKKKEETRAFNLSQVEITTTPFSYDFSMGSKSSIRFLESYSRTNSKEFLLSDWRLLVLHKYNRVWGYNLVVAMVFWLFTVCTAIFVVIQPYFYVGKISLVCNFLLFIYEIFQFLASSSYKMKRYFKDPLNWVDLFLYLLILLYFFSEKYFNSEEFRKILSALLLICIFYRGFSYFKVVPFFTSIVGIISTVIRKLGFFLFILLYFYVSTGLLYALLDKSQATQRYFVSSYVWVLFGGININDVERNYLTSIAIFFGTILVTIILLNILIAYLSNLFSRLEHQQQQDELREKAKMVLDMEIFVLFFKKLKRKLFGIKENKFLLQELYSDLFEGRIGTYMTIIKNKDISFERKQENHEKLILKSIKKIERQITDLGKRIDLVENQINKESHH